MKQSLMQESGCPNLIRNITKVTCQKSDVRGVITIPWSVLSESPPKALSFFNRVPYCCASLRSFCMYCRFCCGCSIGVISISFCVLACFFSMFNSSRT